MKTRILILFVLLALLSACAPQAESPAGGNAIEVTNVVLGLSSGSTMSGMDMGGEVIAYMLIKNHGATKDRLIGVTTDFGNTRIHETVIENDVATMKVLDNVDIPANSTVEFKQGGLHIIILDLKAGLKAGDTVSLTLKFEKAGDVTVSAILTDQ
jgi:copper(I)-binding protein